MAVASNSQLSPVTELVRRYIVENSLQAGDRFPTDLEFAERIGVGLSSLRYAMRTLGQLGVVSRRRKAGTFLVDPDPSHLAAHIKFHVDLGTYSEEEIRRARAVFEQGLAAEAARNRTTRNLLEMTVAIDALVMAEGDFEAVKQADRDFHAAVLSAAQNPLASVFSKVIEASFERLPPALRVTAEGESFRRVVAEHKEIFASISQQKPDVAGELIYQHIAYPKNQSTKMAEHKPVHRGKKAKHT
jgi:GntR family transcriptional repressor for pyruvate dehydrogenase complex